MSRETLTAKDYPLAENRADLVRGARGKSLDDLSLTALEQGDVVMEDLRITPDALTMQADIARTEHRDKLAENFDRAAELINVPQDYLMQIYELLRPGRARNQAVLLDVADTLRTTYDAPQMAAFIEEAAEVYDRRGLFTG
ncbi:MAG: propanediol dehydratase small subunit [Paracoccaceae bacterium]|jgi:propanediol dehydratase small subunit